MQCGRKDSGLSCFLVEFGAAPLSTSVPSHLALPGPFRPQAHRLFACPYSMLVHTGQGPGLSYLLNTWSSGTL